MFTSTGILDYHTSWLILNCCSDLTKYYRRSLKIKALAAPAFGSHISVVAGSYEVPVHRHLWGKYQGAEIEFAYGHEIQSHDGYHWLTIYCDQLLDIREELGLIRELRWALHLTIAKERN